jgi:hypothetical protein
MKILLLLLLLVFAINGIKIRCEFHFLDYDEIGKLYTCTVRWISNADSDTHITEVEGNHEDSKSNIDVTAFRAEQSEQFYFVLIPMDINKFFPNIIAIQFQKSMVNHLEGDEFVAFPNLQLLELENSNIHEIPGSLFTATPQIKVVSFKSNFIGYVGEDLLEGRNLKELKKVDFTQNPCIDIKASTPTEVPAMIKTLKEKCNIQVGSEEKAEETCTMTDGGTGERDNVSAKIESIQKDLNEKFSNLEKQIEKLHGLIQSKV